MQGPCDLPFRRQRVTSHIVGCEAGTLLRQAEIQQLDAVLNLELLTVRTGPLGLVFHISVAGQL